MSSVQNSVLPLFAKAVFIDALRDFGIPFVVADGDGDPDCVALANHLECPVLADDADFFIFNIDNGYVPLRDSSGSFIDISNDVRCYLFKSFDTQLGFPSHDQRLYIPLLLKSNPHPERNSKIYEVCRYIEGLLEIIQAERKYCGYERIEISQGIADEMKSLRSFYRVKPASYASLKDSKKLAELNPEIPQWIFPAYKDGKFNLTMMYALVSRGNWRYSCVIEDTTKCSAWAVVNKPRLFILGGLCNLLGVGRKMFEAKRSGIPLSICYCEVKLKEKYIKVWKEIGPENRQKFLVKCFNCKHIQISLVAKIPDEFKLATVACRAWFKTDKEKLKPLVAPLVYCILSCSGLYPKLLCIPEQYDEICDLDLLHSFAQWQCLLHHAIALNQLLGCPFQYTSPAQLFSCFVVKYFCSNPPPQPFEELPSLMINVICKL